MVLLFIFGSFLVLLFTKNRKMVLHPSFFIAEIFRNHEGPLFFKKIRGTPSFSKLLHPSLVKLLTKRMLLTRTLHHVVNGRTSAMRTGIRRPRAVVVKLPISRFSFKVATAARPHNRVNYTQQSWPDCTMKAWLSAEAAPAQNS